MDSSPPSPEAQGIADRANDADDAEDLTDVINKVLVDEMNKRIGSMEVTEARVVFELVLECVRRIRIPARGRVRMSIVPHWR